MKIFRPYILLFLVAALVTPLGCTEAEESANVSPEVSQERLDPGGDIPPEQRIQMGSKDAAGPLKPGEQGGPGNEAIPD